MSDRFNAAARREAGAGIIDLVGVLDGDSAAALTEAYAAAAADADRILLNFEPMTFMNSSGIALVVELLARARVEGRAVHAAGLSDHYRHIFEITRLSDFMTIHDDMASAVA
ncbi:MAG: STAS domain-containing protein [Chloroflexi bacterium]|nr:STAS domain-containing protein [Chloroflexota bacterium]